MFYVRGGEMGDSVMAEREGEAGVAALGAAASRLQLVRIMRSHFGILEQS
jgi:hypothetical protein